MPLAKTVFLEKNPSTVYEALIFAISQVSSFSTAPARGSYVCVSTVASASTGDEFVK